MLQGGYLDLADTLAGYAELLGYTLQGDAIMAVESESALCHLALFVVEFLQPMVQIGLDGMVMDLIRGIRGRFVLELVQELLVRVLAVGVSTEVICSFRSSMRLTSLLGLFRRPAISSRGGLVVELLGEAPGHLEIGVDLLGHMNGKADRTRLIHDGPLDALADPLDGVGRKAEATLRVELLHGPHKTEISFLDQVREGEPAVQIAMRDLDHHSRRLPMIIRWRAASSPW